VIADPDMADFPFLLQLMKRSEYLGHLGRAFNQGGILSKMLDRQRTDRPMQHIQVDIIGLQPFQTGFTVRSEHIRLRIRGAYLAADHRFVTPSFQRSAERNFACSVVINLGCIEIIHPQIERLVHDLVHIPLTLLPPIAASAILPAAHPEYTDLQIGRSQSSFLHTYASIGGVPLY
jgi:hypothetical protein